MVYPIFIRYLASPILQPTSHLAKVKWSVNRVVALKLCGGKGGTRVPPVEPRSRPRHRFPSTAVSAEKRSRGKKTLAFLRKRHRLATGYWSARLKDGSGSLPKVTPTRGHQSVERLLGGRFAAHGWSTAIEHETPTAMAHVWTSGVAS